MNLRLARANVREGIERVAPAFLLKSYRFRGITARPNLRFVQRRRLEAELALLPLLLSDINDGSAIDVGANVGYYTFVIEKLFGADRTYAVEPQAALHEKLERLFPKVHLLKTALSDSPGDSELRIPIVKGLPLESRATLENFSEINETGATSEIVAVDTLDRLCDRLSIRDIRFVKIDVEGHEHRVLGGATNVLDRYHPILQVEIEQRHHQIPITDIFKIIEARGYAGFFLRSREQKLIPLADFSVSKFQNMAHFGGTDYINNFLFFPEPTAQTIVQNVHRRLKAFDRSSGSGNGS